MDTLVLATTLISMGFPERLAAERKRRGLTQKGLAKASGMSHIQVHRYEAGNAQPTLDAIKRLAIALSVTTDELIFGEDERGPSDDLRLQFEAVSAFDPEDREVARVVIESLILRNQSKRWIDGPDTKGPAEAS